MRSLHLLAVSLMLQFLVAGHAAAGERERNSSTNHEFQAPAAVQSGFEMGGNLSFFTGDLSELNDTGWGAYIGFSLATRKFEIGLTGDYHQNSGSLRLSGASIEANKHDILVVGNFKIRTCDPYDCAAVPYFIFGVGVASWHSVTEVRGSSFLSGGTDSGTDFVYVLGAGLQIRMSEDQTKRFFIQIRSFEGDESVPFGAI